MKIGLLEETVMEELYLFMLWNQNWILEACFYDYFPLIYYYLNYNGYLSDENLIKTAGAKGMFVNRGIYYEV